jgi:hypothetical protein
MKVYLAGPMSGIPAFNIPEFDKAARALRELGYEVVSPAEVDGETTRDTLLQSAHGSHDDLPPSDGGWSAYLARDLRIIADEGIEAIVTLPGWERSRGARCEVAIAEALNIPRRSYREMATPLDDFAVSSGDDDACAEKLLDELGPLAHHAPPRATQEPALYEPDGSFINPLRQRAITGAVKDNRGKPRVELLPVEPLLAVGRVLGFGAAKYKPNNWRLGLSWSQTIGSALRHIFAFAGGEDMDSESGEMHIDNAICQLMFLSTYWHTKTGEDDRWSSLPEEARESSKA